MKRLVRSLPQFDLHSVGKGKTAVYPIHKAGFKKSTMGRGDGLVGKAFVTDMWGLEVGSPEPM